MEKHMMELELDDLEKKGINRYKAVIMASQEARFINDQVRLGIVKPEDKPTTMALRRLFEGRVIENETPEAEA
ncbi:MAG TPA: DNA-directed RNA polymerase subunit omega [Chitinivibrionales bacterium]